MESSSPARVIRRVLARLNRLRPTGDDAVPETDLAGPQQTGPEVGEPAHLVARLTRAHWTERDGVAVLAIEGSAWRRGGAQTGSAVTAVQWQSEGRELAFEVEPMASGSINYHSRMPAVDRSTAGFVATLAVDRLRQAIADAVDRDELIEIRGAVRITVTDQQGPLTGGFGSRDESGSAGQLQSCYLGDRAVAQPAWDAERGLVLTLARRAAVAERIGLTGTRLEATILIHPEFPAVGAMLRQGEKVRPLAAHAADGRLQIDDDLADLLPGPDDPPAAVRYLHVVDERGRTRHVHWQGSLDQPVRRPSADLPQLAVHYGAGGVIRIDANRALLLVDTVAIAGDATQPRLTIEGTALAVSDQPRDWRLVGGRSDLVAATVELDRVTGRFSTAFALLAVPEWGTRPMPLPTTTFELSVDGIRAGVDQRLGQQLPLALQTTGNRIVARRAKGARLELSVGVPLPDGARSGYQKQRLEIMHRDWSGPLVEAVLYNSFNGKAANDNTRAVHDELLRRAPGLRRLWTVADLSVEVPEGSEPVILWSEAWWRALSESRYLVTNCWMPAKYQRRDDQQLLQTWHGTPLKLLGFDRIGTNRGEAYRSKTRHEVAQWSALIAQNRFSRDVFRSAYGYQGPILEIGYPRNDVLSRAGTGAADVAAAVRERLGIGADELVVLYTPTWREGSGSIFAELDLEAVQRSLGPDGRVLVRGHVNTIKHGGRVSGSVLDVTLYPELADLYLASDVMITDYSSTMFDFSVTGKPMIFFVPDIEDYTGRRRGTYFDLGAEAPGPLLSTTDEVIKALADLPAAADRYADRYRRWREKFNPYDDGQASRRAVDALLQQ